MACVIGRRLAFSCLVSSCDRGKVYDEGGAFAFKALHLDGTPHAFYQTAGDGQAEAAAFVRAAQAVAFLLERLEEVRQESLAHTYARIADLQMDPRRRLACLNDDLAFFSELDRVADEVV